MSATLSSLNDIRDGSCLRGRGDRICRSTPRRLIACSVGSYRNSLRYLAMESIPPETRRARSANPILTDPIRGPHASLRVLDAGGPSLAVAWETGGSGCSTC